MSVTVAVPVFNAEDSIEGCIENIQKQTYAGTIETILVVDSKTTDNTLEILKKPEYSDIKVIIQKDADRQSGAKNIALNEATCDYIWFFDADDLVCPTFLEEMISLCEKTNSDIVSCNHFYSYEYNIIKPEDKNYKSITVNGPEAGVMLFEGKIPMENWCKVFRTELLKKNNIYFDPERYSEDFDQSIRSFTCAKKVTHYEKPLYTYYLHDSSCSAGVGDKIAKRDIDVTRKILDEVREKDPLVYEKYCKSSIKHLLRSLTNTSSKEFKILAKDPIFKECLSFKQDSFNAEIFIFKLSPGLYHFIGKTARKIKFSKKNLVFKK